MNKKWKRTTVLGGLAYPEGMICECVRAFVEDYREHRIFEEKKKTIEIERKQY